MGKVSLSCGPFSAWIQIDGHKNRLPVYGRERPEGSVTKSAWTCSTPEKAFSVHIGRPRKRQSNITACRILLDGFIVAERSLHLVEPNKNFTLHHVAMRRFRFVSATEGPLPEDEIYMSRIGTIRIEFFDDLSVTRVEKYIPDIQLPKKERPYKTAVPHHVKMCMQKKRGGESSWERSQGRSDVHIPDDVLPYRVLEFKYRPLDYLVSHGIIPPNQNATLVPAHAKSAAAEPQRRRQRVNIEADADTSERAEASRPDATTSTMNEDANEQATAQVASTSRITPGPSSSSSVFTQPASSSRTNVATSGQPLRSVVEKIHAPLSTPKPNTGDARRDKHARQEEVKDEEPGTNQTAGASANGQGTRASRTPSASYLSSIFARPSCPHGDTSGKRKRDLGESGQAVSSTSSSSGNTRTVRGDKPASRKKIKIEDPAPSVKEEDESASLRTTARPQPGEDDKAVILERIKSMEEELGALRRMLKAPAPISHRAIPPATTIDLTGDYGS